MEVSSMLEVCSLVRRRSTVHESFGERLARLRKERGITQVELAEKVGLAQPNISDYERGRFQPSAPLIIKLVAILGVSADDLLGLTRTRSNGDAPRPRLMKRLTQIDKLPAHRQRALLTTIDVFLKGVATG
jgi:transcriptional regulator with XRE-family HTH domain